MTSPQYYPVIIIGAGQAGLSMAALLQTAQVDYLIIGKERRVGDQWRERYDSLRLFTPRWMNCLPGQTVPPDRDPAGYPHKDEVADALEAYAHEQQLNVQLDTGVVRLALSEQDSAAGRYIVETTRGAFLTSQLVIATGPFQQPFIPDLAANLSPEVYQVHTATYRNPSQLQEGPVLVVGCGNSGAQIAVELAEQHTGDVHLSVSEKPLIVPQNILGKSIFWWFKVLGVYKAHIDTALGRRLSRRGDPVIGKELKAHLRSGKVKLHPRTLATDGGTVRFADGEEIKVRNLVWGTGFVSDYSWLQVPGVLAEDGRPLHRRGVTNAPGIYFLGLPWQHNRASALIGGVSGDAHYLLSHLLSHFPEANRDVSLA